MLSEVMLTALAPMIPSFKDHSGLSVFHLGLLTAMFPLGLFLVSIAMLLLRRPKSSRSILVAGLIALAVSSALFRADVSPLSAFALRLVQGGAAALIWAGALALTMSVTAHQRRGTAIGTLFGAAIFGSLIGPLIGAVAVDNRSPLPATGLVTIAAVVVAFCVLRLASPPAPADDGGPPRAFPTVRLFPLWLATLPAILFGTYAILVPIQLEAAGAVAWTVAATFVLGGLVEAPVSRLSGVMSDRRGVRPVTQIVLLTSTALMLIAAAQRYPLTISLVMIFAAASFGGLYPPAISLLVDAIGSTENMQLTAAALTNLCWAVGQTLGSIAGGALTDAAGIPTTYVVLAALCVLTLLLVRVRRVPTP